MSRRSRRSRRSTDAPHSTPRGPAADSPGSRWTLLLLTLFLIACAVRWLHVRALAGVPLFDVLLGDSRRYVEWAAEIASGNWIGSGVFYQAPLYPYVLGLTFALFGVSIEAVRVLQAIGGALACVLVAMAGRRFFGWKAGLVAGGLLALYPPAIFFDGHLQKSSLDLLLMASVLFAAGEYVSSRRDRWLVVLGVALGCLTLNRENARVLFPFLAVWLFAWNRDLVVARRVRAVAAFTLATCLPIAPVALRNYTISGELLISTSQLGPNFYMGNHLGASGVYEPLVPGRGNVRDEQDDAVRLASEARGRPLTPGEVSEYWLSKALDEIRRDPVQWARLMGRKALLSINTVESMDTESLEFHATYSPVLRLLRPFTFGGLLPLAVLGFVVTAADWRRLIVLYGIGLLFMASVVLFFVMSRYRYPAVPVVALFAGAGLSKFGAAWREQRARASAALACAVVAGLVVNVPMRATSEETYANFGTELLRANRPAEAIPLLMKAAELAPGDPSAHRDLAMAHLRAGDTAAAVREYLKVVELEPRDAANHREVAIAAAADGDVQAAETHFREALRLEPANAAIRLKLGDLFLQTNRLADARREYDAALVSAGPVETVNLLVRLGSLDVKDGRPADAVAKLEKAAALARSSGQDATAKEVEMTLEALRGQLRGTNPSR